MITSPQTLSIQTDYTEPFEDRIDILYRELELAIKWERPSLLLVIYGSEYVHADADISLENRLSDLGQRAYHIKIKNKGDGDISSLISELANVKNVTFFIEGLRWGDEIGFNVYRNLNKHREFFIDNKVKVVFWLTENEAVDFAHYAPDCWAYRHRVIEFTDQPRTDQLSPRLLESAWQGIGSSPETVEELDAKIAFRTALLTDLPDGTESTAARANLLLTLGILHWRRGDLEKAMQYIGSTINLAEKLNDAAFEAMCLNAKALVETDLGQYDEAVKTYQRAISLAPEKIYPWNNLGNLYVKLGHFEDALPAFQKGIEQNPEDAVSWNGMGDVYQKMGRNDDALYAYMKTLELVPNQAQTWCNLAKTYANDERLDEAFSAHQRALEIDRHIIDSWIGLGDISRRQGREEDALRAYTAATEIEPQNARVWVELGDLYYNARADDKAFQAYQKAIELGHSTSQIYNNLASISVHKGSNDETLHFLKKGIELSNNTTERVLLWNRLGDTYRRLGDYENAIASYRKADELNPNAAQQRRIPPASTSESPNTSTNAENREELEAVKVQEPVVQEIPSENLAETQASEKTSEVKGLETPVDVAENALAAVEIKAEDEVQVIAQPPVEQVTEPVTSSAAPQEITESPAMETTPDASTIEPSGSDIQPALMTVEEDVSTVENQTAEVQVEEVAPVEEPPVIGTDATAPVESLQAETAPQAAQQQDAAPDPGALIQPQNSQTPVEENPEPTVAVTELQTEDAVQPTDTADTQPIPLVESSNDLQEASAQENETPLPDEPREERVEVDFAEWLSSLGDLSADPVQLVDEAVEPENQEPAAEAEIGPESSPEESPVAEAETESACWVYKNKNTDPPDEQIEPKADPKLVILGSRMLSDETDNMNVPSTSGNGDDSSGQEETQEVQPQKVVLDIAAQDQTDIDSKNAQIWNELGNIYFNAGKVDDAVHAFNKAMELDPQYGWTYYNLACLFVHRGQYNESIPLYIKGLNLLKNPKEKALIWNHLGDAHRRLGDHENAKIAYDKAQELEAEKTSLLTRARLSLLGNCKA